MTRRYFLFLLSSSGAAWLLSACGHAVSQPVAKVPRIGVLVSASEPHPFADALRHGLQNLGYSEGRNITLDVRYTQGRSDLAAQFAAELVKSDVAMIVAHFTPRGESRYGGHEDHPNRDGGGCATAIRIHQEPV
jgi:putative tryptophan/tyrosine transport system substrate-binding protein